jgi:hypothetical protein
MCLTRQIPNNRIIISEGDKQGAYSDWKKADELGDTEDKYIITKNCK